MSKMVGVSAASFMAKSIVRIRKRHGASFPVNAVVELTKFIAKLPADDLDELEVRLAKKVRKLEKAA